MSEERSERATEAEERTPAPAAEEELSVDELEEVAGGDLTNGSCQATFVCTNTSNCPPNAC